MRARRFLRLLSAATATAAFAGTAYAAELTAEDQIFKPRVPYPKWDASWDLVGDPTSNNPAPVQSQTKSKTSRHLLLIRHGQYDEESDDHHLTNLGCTQADTTGKRLRAIVDAERERVANEGKTKFRPGQLHVSTMLRARQTADIIAKYLPDFERTDPDELLAEGRPAQTIPGNGQKVASVERDAPRIESAFRKYVRRSDVPSEEKEHVMDVVVCHGNVIRYFFCRALQLPPEAWLRLCTFNCSITYLTISPSGHVSSRTMGDVGHLPPEQLTFSMHYGMAW